MNLTMQALGVRLNKLVVIAFAVCIAYVAVLLGLAWDELPFLHPGRKHVYLWRGDKTITNISLGEYELPFESDSETLWVTPGTYELRMLRDGQKHSETVQIVGETYIDLHGNPPYIDPPYVDEGTAGTEEMRHGR